MSTRNQGVPKILYLRSILGPGVSNLAIAVFLGVCCFNPHERKVAGLIANNIIPLLPTRSRKNSASRIFDR